MSGLIMETRLEEHRRHREFPRFQPVLPASPRRREPGCGSGEAGDGRSNPSFAATYAPDVVTVEPPASDQ